MARKAADQAVKLTLESRAEIAVMRACGHNDHDRQNNYAMLNPATRQDRVAFVLEQLRAVARHVASRDEVRREALLEAANAIPTSWLDPLLSGGKAPKVPMTGPALETMLRAIVSRIRALSRDGAREAPQAEEGGGSD